MRSMSQDWQMYSESVYNPKQAERVLILGYGIQDVVTQFPKGNFPKALTILIARFMALVK